MVFLEVPASHNPPLAKDRPYFPVSHSFQTNPGFMQEREGQECGLQLPNSNTISGFAWTEEKVHMFPRNNQHFFKEAHFTPREQQKQKTMKLNERAAQG